MVCSIRKNDGIMYDVNYANIKARGISSVFLHQVIMNAEGQDVDPH